MCTCVCVCTYIYLYVYTVPTASSLEIHSPFITQYGSYGGTYLRSYFKKELAS